MGCDPRPDPNVPPTCGMKDVPTPAVGEARVYFGGIDANLLNNYASHLVVPQELLQVNVPASYKKKCKDGEYGKWSVLVDVHCDEKVHRRPVAVSFEWRRRSPT